MERRRWAIERLLCQEWFDRIHPATVMYVLLTFHELPPKPRNMPARLAKKLLFDRIAELCANLEKLGDKLSILVKEGSPKYTATGGAPFHSTSVTSTAAHNEAMKPMKKAIEITRVD